MGVDLFLTLLWQFWLCMLLDALLGLHETNFQQIRILLLFGDFWPVPGFRPAKFYVLPLLSKIPNKGLSGVSGCPEHFCGLLGCPKHKCGVVRCLENFCVYLAALNTYMAYLGALNSSV